jgi:hypothetical protein
MKPVAIIGAMQQELAGLKQALQGAHTIQLGTRQVTSGTWHGHPWCWRSRTLARWQPPPPPLP